MIHVCNFYDNNIYYIISIKPNNMVPLTERVFTN